MEKIMVLTEQSEPDHDLLALLNELFPDCEIQIVFKETEIFGEYPASCFHFRVRRTQQERNDGEHFGY
jgi:hypothetical protein